MADVMGRISVPATVLSTGGAGISGTQVFPLATELSSYGFSVERPVVVHRFGSMDAKQEQRFYSGVGPHKFRFSRGNLGWTEARELRTFFESMQGPWEAFTYNVPNPGGTTTAVLVTFEETPVSFQYLRNACQTGFNLIEVVDPTAALTYAVTSAPCLRFPSTSLSTALLSEVQEIVPLIHIRVQEATVPDIWLSDRRLTLTDGAAGAVAAALGWAGSSQLYLPRLTGIGEPGSDVLITQDIKGSSDTVRFTFGNADRAMTQLANDTDLKYAQIDFCAYHVNSGILIQIWKGVIQNYTSDGTPNFPVTCSDGFFQIMNQYPERQASRQCWKTYNDGVYCLWATKGASGAAVTAAGGDPNSCDFYLESANGCQVHGMAPFFGGQQCDPQGVIVKDDSTGFLGFGRNKVTATSIITEYIWGLALPEIWCNSGGNALYAFMANALMVAYRDESTYADSLGILGAGPLGGFTPSQIVANADGYRYVAAPMVDGYTWQGFQVNGNLNITKNQPGMGLRQVLGNDPANPSTDSFSLGQGTPQVWEPNNYAAGVAFCELRITKSSTIQPSTPDQHQMTVPLDYGLSGFVWDQHGNRSVVAGLINPFWICVNMLLRAMGLTAGLEAPLNTQTITVTLPPSSFFSFSGSTIGDFEIVAFTGNPIGMWACLIAWIGSAFTGNAYNVPMSNAANQAEVLLQQNLYNWRSLAPRYQTAANRTIFAANFTTVWQAYYQACNAIAGPNPTGNAEAALLASLGDRERGGKFDWFAAYSDPIASSATPGDSMSYPSVSAQQLSAFVLSSLIVGDGSGAAEIAAAQVPAILGTGDEIQFQFQGSLSSQKPFRDWLTEVLNCCLGFYTWEFGKLKLGCRINASAADAYTIGSVLFQSLRLTPIVAAFEHLIISYADVAYQYQTNTADYVDKSHAAYYGRAGSPLTSPMHSVGISTLSQALRIAATRTREECGGVTPMEWRNARNASWQTTLLGLGNEVGQVVSMTHPDIPGARGTCNVTGATATWESGDVWTYAGTANGDTELVNKAILIGGAEVTITAVAGDGSTITTNPAPPSGTGLAFHVITMCFRVQKWSLKKDWSVQLEGQTVTASMYDLDVGPKPVDVAPAPPSPIFYAIPAGPVWAPYQVQASASDALFPGEWTFDSDQEYMPLADGTAQASLIVTGKLPVNEFSATGAGAPGVGLVGQASTGGSLPAMVTLYVAICAIDSSGLPSVPSSILVLGTSVTGTDSFTLANIAWPAVTGLASFVLFVASQDDLICEQLTGALTPTGNGTTYSPSSITFSGPLTRSTWAMPSPYVAKVRVKAKLLRHSGVVGASVTSVSSNTIVSSDMVDTSATPFNAAGRVLSIIGRPNASTPFASFNITAHVPATGTLTLDRDPTGIVLPGDAFAIRFKADSLNAQPAEVTSVNDNGCKNSLNAYGGMGVVAGVGVEVGNLIRVIGNTGRGQPPSTITANTATGLTFQPALLMDETSVWIVEGPTWAFQADSTSIDNASPLTPVTLSVPTANFIKQPMLIGGFTVDVNGNESPDGDAPIREDWIYGAAGNNASPGATLQVDGTLAIGSNQAPPLQLNANRTPSAVLALVGTAPTGAGLTVNINVGGALWMALTIAAGNVSAQATSTQLMASGAIGGSASMTLDITAVGTTVPGSDLSVFISFDMAAISKLEPHRSIYLRGFDRRGAAAAMTNASAGGFTVSGCWSDQADFAVCVLFDADDQFGHLYTSRYLPDFSLAGVTLDFDLTLIGCQSPASQKYQSVPWGSLSYITRTVSGGAVTEIQGSVSLLGGAAAGGTSATATVTLSGTPATGDRLYIYYLGNTGYDTGIGQSYSVATGDSVADVAAKLAGLVATLHSTDSTTYPLTASSSGADVTFTAPAGADGNDIALLAMAAGGTTFTPTWLLLGGGTDPASIHVHLDFSALGLASARQVWLTFAPPVSPQYGRFLGDEWSAVFSNWTVGDPGGVTPLKLAGPGSVTITSDDSWVTRAGSGWAQVAGWYVDGFAYQSANAGDTVTVKYSCQSVHNLYWGTALSTAGGAISVSVDGGAAVAVSAYSLQSAASPTSGPRLIAAAVAAGTHAVVLTVASGTCLFDYLQAAILSDPVAPPATYPAVSCACDFDTGQTYQIAPARLLWILSQAGFAGDIDFYAGVFFALKRVRNGGHFRQATVTLSLPPLTPLSGTVWITVGGATGSGTPVSGDTSTGGNPTGSGVLGGTVFGAAAISCDTLLTIARRLANAINGMFVGIWAAASISTPGQLIIAVLSPINGFSLDVSLSSDSTLTLSVTGDIGIGGVGGNEGTWAVAPTKNAAAGVVPETAPLNRAFVDYLTDLAALVQAAGQTMTVAFSQELLAPPDLQTCAAPSVTFGFFNYFGTGYVHQITVGANTYSYTQLAGDGSGDIANALTALVRGDPNASAFASANNVSLITAGPGLVACSASDGNGPGTLASGAWCQRFASGATVLTATGFGSWGAGVVDAVSGSGPQTVEQIGHGYVTGNSVHIAQGSDGAVWAVTVTDADHYQLTTLVSGTAFTVVPGATTLIDLQTAQCCFNPATATAYLQNCYLQAAGILSAAGLAPWLQLGEVGWWFFSRLMNEAIGYASWTAPISIGTVAAHGLATGQNAIVAAVGGTTAANGTFPIVVTDATHFTETGSSGNAAYIAGGTVSGGGMAYYDPYTAAAALTALGRALANFWTQDDDPSVNSHLDANFLRSLVYAHMHTIAQAVKAAYAGAKIEWLLPLDTNNPTVYWNAGYPYPQGGRMNNYVNIPSEYMAPNADIDRVKLEALSWGASYLNLDLAKAAMAYGHAVLTYANPATAYLIPWYNGACAWTAQYLAAANAGIPLICFWAVDHLTLLSWPLPLPINKRRARLF